MSHDRSVKLAAINLHWLLLLRSLIITCQGLKGWFDQTSLG